MSTHCWGARSGVPPVISINVAKEEAVYFPAKVTDPPFLVEDGAYTSRRGRRVLRPERFWMFDWLDDHNITSTADVAELLPKYRVVDDLRTRAEGWQRKQSVAKRGDVVSLVAGAGIDLTGGDLIICPSPECMRRQVDTLFKRAWHYFDEMVVQDVFTPALLDELDGAPYGFDVIRDVFLSHLEPLLYLREIGAEYLVDFQPKILPCKEHWEDERTRSRVRARSESVSDNPAS
jgi:hypothetical protein